MSYRSSDKSRRKKDAKRTAMMQTAVKIFADKGYHAATVRDIVGEAGVSVGTFYFYFPDKETLFLYLYEETADFLVHTIQQAIGGRRRLPEQVAAGVQAYANVALYEPAVVHLLLIGGVGAVPSLRQKYDQFRENITAVWQRLLDETLDDKQIPDQNTRRTAEAIAGGVDQVILNLIDHPLNTEKAPTAVYELTHFILRAVGFHPDQTDYGD